MCGSRDVSATPGEVVGVDSADLGWKYSDGWSQTTIRRQRQAMMLRQPQARCSFILRPWHSGNIMRRGPNSLKAMVLRK